MKKGSLVVIGICLDLPSDQEICAKNHLKKPTKRQIFYIFGRSRYIIGGEILQRYIGFIKRQWKNLNKPASTMDFQRHQVKVFKKLRSLD